MSVVSFVVAPLTWEVVEPLRQGDTAGRQELCYYFETCKGPHSDFARFFAIFPVSFEVPLTSEDYLEDQRIGNESGNGSCKPLNDRPAASILGTNRTSSPASEQGRFGTHLRRLGLACTLLVVFRAPVIRSRVRVNMQEASGQS